MSVGGLDECGKGCVLGAAVHCCFIGEVDRLPSVVRRLVADSKKMTERSRELVYRAIVDLLSEPLPELTGESDGQLVAGVEGLFRFSLVITSAGTIDRDGNLNDIFARSTVRAIELARGADRPVIHLDRLGPTEAYHLALLRKHGLPDTEHITSQTRAEDAHTQVALASVLGKVYRDHMLRRDLVRHGITGSLLQCTGYPRDDTTRLLRLLLDQREKHPLIRYSWLTVRRMLADQPVEKRTRRSEDSYC